MKLILIAIFVSILAETYTLNILGIFPYEGHSHFLQFRVYLKELAKRKHNVTVISYFPEKNSLPNYHDISLGETAPMILDSIDYEEASYRTTIESGWFLTSSGIRNCKTLVSNNEVRDLVKRKPKFDVVIVEQFNSDCAFGIAYKLQAPVVLGITSHVLMPYHYKRLGIPNNPAYVPFHFFGGGRNPTLYQRVERAIFNFYFTSLYAYQQWADGNSLAEYYTDIPALEELARRMKFMFLSQHYLLFGSRMYPSNVIEIGGFHVEKAKPLTGALKAFVEEAEQGVIYLNFGSLLKISGLSSEKQKALFDAFSEFPQRFVVRHDGEIPKNLKNKVYFSNWLPQNDILAHPKTVVFISHGGMGGTVEALHHGVPMVVIPFYGDQPSNAAAVEESGFGVALNSISKESIVAGIKKVLEPTFRAKSLQVSQAWHDRPMHPLDTAVYWTEYAARYPNFTFHSTAADIPLYQHFYLDIAAVIFLVPFLIGYIIKYIICSLCCGITKKASTSKGKKKSKRE